MTTWRHPYVAIFYGSPATTPNRQAVEILQSNAGNAPYAILATWLIDDGFVGQALEARPDPPCFNWTERFVDCGNGTVTDTVTGLIHLKNANCFGESNWVAANYFAAELADGSCGLTDGSRAGDWRLQTWEEFKLVRCVELYCNDCAPPRGLIGNWTDENPVCYSDSPWATGVVSAFYWSSSTADPYPPHAWGVALTDGSAFGNPKTELHYVWPVRGGQ
jgi:hypothetical protein